MLKRVLKGKTTELLNANYAIIAGAPIIFGFAIFRPGPAPNTKLNLP